MGQVQVVADAYGPYSNETGLRISLNRVKIRDFLIFSTFSNIWIFGHMENVPRHIITFQISNF